MPPPLSTSLLGALRCFDAAARHMSFTRAAEELSLTTGAVSQQIRQLEERLGYLLFNRLGRSIVLTPQGEMLKETAAAAFTQIGETIRVLDSESRPLVISCTPSFAQLWLMPRLGRFYEAFPDSDIKVIAEFQSVDRSSLGVGNIDVAIRYDTATYSSIHVYELMGEFLLPAASPGYLRRHEVAMRDGGLSSLSLLHDSDPWDGAEPISEWSVWAGAVEGDELPAARKGQEFNLFALAMQAAQHELGVCMARVSLILDQLRDGRLVDFTHRPVQSPATYKLLTTRPDDPGVARLSEWLRQECVHTEALRSQVLGEPTIA